MNVIKDYAFQLMFVAIPIFTYHTFFKEELKKDKAKLVMATLWGLSIILCISNPAHFGSGHRLDIRIIPLLLGTLYGGYITGIFLSGVIILVYLLLFGVNIGLYNTVLALLCSVPVIIYFQKTFEKTKKEKRVIIAVLLSVYYFLVGISCFSILNGLTLSYYLQAQLIYLPFTVISTWLLTTLNENIKEIHQLRVEVQNAEKLRVIGDLTGVFAHEIRNPLQVTRGFLQLLKESDSTEKKKQYIDISIDELDRANEIIGDLLSFGKPSTNNTEPIDVALQLRRVINMVQVYSQSKNVQIKTDISQNCWIHGNAQKLNQCLINIIKNAVESMLHGGLIWITCTTEDNGYIKICIKDQGIGMTKEQIEKLGSPYYSLKESGTGLGMMVSLQIVRSFNGKIKVTSEKDIGTEFTILLPELNDDLSSSAITGIQVHGVME